MSRVAGLYYHLAGDPRGAVMAWLIRSGQALVAMVALYLLAALSGSLIPVNAGRVTPADGITIHVLTNGYHTGLLLPVSADGIDLSLTFRPTDLPDADMAGQYMLFGWGDRDFYLNTQTWADLRPKTVLVAVFGSGGSLLHIDHIQSPAEVEDARPVQLTSAEYQVLVAEIKSFAKVGADGFPIAVPGYGSRDVFYEATGRYSALRTCNVWTGERLAAAGVKVGRWTPFSGGLMLWF